MSITRGFTGRRGGRSVTLPPGQHLVHDFPVLSTGPAPTVDRETWRLTVTGVDGASRAWTWQEFTALPTEDVVVDLHCVTGWSKLGTTWTGISVDVLLAGVTGAASDALVHAYGGYTANLAVDDLVGGRAWVAFAYDGKPLTPEHGGPARLIVPHLYLWKSVKWISSLELLSTVQRGFWENLGYHDRGDPWQEQRYASH